MPLTLGGEEGGKGMEEVEGGGGKEVEEGRGEERRWREEAEEVGEGRGA